MTAPLATQIAPLGLREILRTIVRGAYDLQKVRIEMGNRICAQFRSKLGLAPSQPEEDDKEAAKVLDRLRERYAKITDGVWRELPRLKDFKGDELISSYAELVLVHEYIKLESSEKSNFKLLEKTLESFPIYTEFLQHVSGCGPALSAIIITEFDPHKAKYPSSFWAYAGFDVGPDGRGRSKRAEHLRKVTYTDKEGKEATRNGITFNPWLKTKLYLLGTCFVKVRGHKYRDCFDHYKNRLQNHPGWVGRTKKNINDAAIRYAVKQFLIDLYKAWRALEGLEVHPPYHEAKLGLRHGQS